MGVWLRAPIDVVDAAVVVECAVAEATSSAANYADQQVMPASLLRGASATFEAHGFTPLASISAPIAASTSSRVCT